MDGTHRAAPAAPPRGPADPRVLLARLDGVRQMGADRWMARCPAHEDRSPSLSVRYTGERVLVYCHAGCQTEDVLVAVGLTWRDICGGDEWAAAYAAATGRRRPSLERAVDPLDVERWVLRIAAADLDAGRELSVEDRARVDLALERLEAER